MPKAIALIMLVTAAVCLLAGPVVLLFLPVGRSTVFTGILMLVYGAIGLWFGMKQLHAGQSEQEEHSG